MKSVTVIEYYVEKYKLDCIYDLDLLETSGEYSRLALPDGENSIWVCDQCGDLADPDEGCPDCNDECCESDEFAEECEDDCYF